MSEEASRLSTTPRLFVQGGLSQGVAITLDQPQSHYLSNGMRRQPGDLVRLFNGRDGEWAARVASVGKKAVTLAAEWQSGPPEAVPDRLPLALITHSRLPRKRAVWSRGGGEVGSRVNFN